MSTDLTDTLKRHYLEHGGTAAGFEENKARLLSEYRTRATINAALEEAAKPLTMNELIRAELREKGATQR
jgi:Flp pilus assembly CpaE family ATPase